MINELDTVVLARDLPEYGLRAGDVGAVVHVYAGGEGYEVEFAAADGEVLALLTLRASDLRSLGGHEILHARALDTA